MKNFFKTQVGLYILATLVFFQVACQNSSSSGSGTGQPPPKKDEKNNGENGNNNTGNNGGESDSGQTLNCEQLWQDYVQRHPVGKLIEKESSTFMVQQNGDKTLTTKSVLANKVTFNNGVKVVEINTTDMKYPVANHHQGESTQSKDKFIADCGQAHPDENRDPKFDFEKLVDETIQVKAGSFLCSHFKMISKPNVLEGVDQMIIENWNSKNHPDINIKSVTRSLMNYDGEAMETLTITELTKLKMN